MTDSAPDRSLPALGAWTPGRRLLTAGLVLLVTGGAFEGLAVPTVLPATLAELRGLELYGWAFSGFWLSNLVGIVVAGAEADRRGTLPPLIIGTFAFAGGLLLAGLAPSMTWVVAGRVVQGLGSGAIAAITYVVIARGYPTAVQPRMIAIISSAWVLPGLVGPALAGWISQELSWRWAFIGLVPLLPLAAIAVGVPMARLPARPEREPAAQDAAPPRAARTVRDALQLAAGAALLLSSPSLGSVPLGIGAAIAGVVVIHAPLRRLLPPGTLTATSRAGAAVASLGLMSVAFFGVEAFVPLAVASVRGAGTLAGGLALTSAAFTWAGGAWIQARLAGRRSPAGLTVVGLVCVGIGILLATTVPITGLPAVPVATGAWAIAGVGMGIAYSTGTLRVIGTAEPGREGAASASVQLAEALGIALGTGLAGAVVALSAAGPLGLAPGIAIADLLLLLVVVAAIAAARRMGGAATHGAEGVPTMERGPSLAP